MQLVFEVNYGGKFDRKHGCIYVGGQLDVYDQTVDPEQLTFFQLENIMKNYGYKHGDLLYFKIPEKSLAEGLSLISSDFDILFLAGCHEGEHIAELYIISFENDGSVEEEDVVEDDRAAKICRNDPWWDDKISDNEDVFDVDYREKGTGTSKQKATKSIPQNDEGGVDPSTDVHPNMDVDPNTDAAVGNEDNDSDEDESDDNDGADVNGTNAGSGNNNEHFIRSFEDVDVDDNASDMARSDILESPVPSDDDDNRPYYKGVDFHEMDIGNPTLTLKMKFASIYLFREAVRQYNVRRGNDIRFHKNERHKCIAKCRDSLCQYRVYARKLRD
jgi:hypothetical protein